MIKRLPALWPRAGLWRHSDFLKLWSGETISLFGSQVTLLGLPLIAILVLEASAFEVALLTAMDYLPFLLFSLPAGVWVDRLMRRPILIVTDVGRAVALATIPIAYASGALTLGQLYAVGFLVGTMTVFFELAYTAYLPALVDRNQLIDGNSKLEISRSAAQIAGPGAGGTLIEVLTAPIAVIADALSFVVSALFIIRIKGGERWSSPLATRRGLRAELAEGLRYVLEHPLFRPLIACTAIVNLFWNLAFAIYLVYLVRELGLTPAIVGLVLTVGNLGWLAGALLANRLAAWLRVGWILVGSAALFGPSWALVALAPQDAPIPFLIMGQAIGSLGGVVYNVTTLTLRQSIVPERMQGRVVGIARTVVWGTIPLGSLIGGVLASTIGLRPAIWVAAVGASTGILPVVLSQARSLVDMPREEIVTRL